MRPQSKNQSKKNIYNLANLITTFRLVCVIIIIILIYPNLIPSKTIQTEEYKLKITSLVAGCLFAVACFSDWLDGYCAKKYNLKSNFGKYYDAFVDKILTNAIIIVFIARALIPIWAGIILISRDFGVDFLRMWWHEYQIIFGAQKIGKIATLTKMLMIIGLIIWSKKTWLCNSSTTYHQLTLILTYLSVLMSAISGLSYMYIAIKFKKSKNQIPSVPES